MPIHTFSAGAVSETPARTVVQTRNFRMVVDEPENLGGSDLGPNPVEYILAALAGCLNVVGHLVAREMGFELRGLRLELEGDLDPARFMGLCRQTRAGYQEISVRIYPETDADPETLERWLHTVEDRCPVSDNLTCSTPVQIRLG